jgi:hypothetical protein
MVGELQPCGARQRERSRMVAEPPLHLHRGERVLLVAISQHKPGKALDALAVGSGRSSACRPPYVRMTKLSSSCRTRQRRRLTTSGSKFDIGDATEELHRRERMDPTETPPCIVPLKDVKRWGRGCARVRSKRCLGPSARRGRQPTAEAAEMETRSCPGSGEKIISRREQGCVPLRRQEDILRRGKTLL